MSNYIDTFTDNLLDMDPEVTKQRERFISTEVKHIKRLDNGETS